MKRPASETRPKYSSWIRWDSGLSHFESRDSFFASVCRMPPKSAGSAAGMAFTSCPTMPAPPPPTLPANCSMLVMLMFTATIAAHSAKSSTTWMERKPHWRSVRFRFSAGFRAFISFRHVTSYSSATKLANVDVFMSSISFSSVIETSHDVKSSLACFIDLVSDSKVSA